MSSTLRTSDDLVVWEKVVVDGFETDWFISKCGMLKNARGKLLANYKNPQGYIVNRKKIRGKDTTLRRHRLVAQAFLTNPRPDIFDIVDHIDRNRANNHYTNLRYVDHQLNALNQKSYHCVPREGFEHPYLAQITFNEVRYWLWDCDTAKEAMNINDRTRRSLFEALYFYRTRPNTFLDPSVEDNWTFTPGTVRVRPSFKE